MVTVALINIWKGALLTVAELFLTGRFPLLLCEFETTPDNADEKDLAGCLSLGLLLQLR